MASDRIAKGIITQEALDHAVIEEYVIGAKFNANLFWSPLTDEIDLLGFDRRIQTDLDGILDLPAQEQLDVNIPTQNIEIGHMGAGNAWFIRVAGRSNKRFRVLRFRC